MACKSEKFCQLGFCLTSVHGFSLNSTHWLQFTDDAAAISGQGQDIQMFLYRITIWCQWAGMTIREEKCCTFASLIVDKGMSYSQCFS